MTFSTFNGNKGSFLAFNGNFGDLKFSGSGDPLFFTFIDNLGIFYRLTKNWVFFKVYRKWGSLLVPSFN